MENNNKKSRKAWLIPRSSINTSNIDEETHIYSFTSLHKDAKVIPILYNNIHVTFIEKGLYRHDVDGEINGENVVKLINELIKSGDTYVMILETGCDSIEYEAIGVHNGLWFKPVSEPTLKHAYIQLSPKSDKYEYFTRCPVEKDTLDKILEQIHEIN